ncbi:MAG TPA: DUF63 family protein [Candidatus Thalassarchaeaceae archaeon]|nr:DUF63 family protein [Candidatus Thalassarchaeaceae archaeon]
MYNPLDEMYPFERWAVNGIIAVSVLVMVGLGLHEIEVENPLSEALYKYYIDPVIGESSGDSGYNMVNTMTYAVVMALFVVSISAWLRGLGVDPSDASILALLPFITWAVFGEVAEDAKMFASDLAPYFVSPGIHFQAAFWVVFSGALGISIGNSGKEDDGVQSNIEIVASILILMQFVLYGSSISQSETVVRNGISLLPLVIATSIALAFTRLTRSSTSAFNPIQKMVYLVGMGGSMIFLGAILSHAFHDPPPTENLWPILVVIGLPSIVILMMHNYGSPAAEELDGHGFLAGILPPGMTEEEYMVLSSPDKDLIESLRMRASMAQPLVFLAVAGQIVDGLATTIGIDSFGYSEKHVLSQKVIDLGFSINEAVGIDYGEGAWAFGLLKMGLGALIYYFFAIANFEHRQQHLRMLIGLALLVVGLAPGLRDVGRLALGV